jgi:hypothetical protein
MQKTPQERYPGVMPFMQDLEKWLKIAMSAPITETTPGDDFPHKPALKTLTAPSIVLPAGQPSLFKNYRIGMFVGTLLLIATVFMLVFYKT